MIYIYMYDNDEVCSSRLGPISNFEIEVCRMKYYQNYTVSQFQIFLARLNTKNANVSFVCDSLDSAPTTPNL